MSELTKRGEQRRTAAMQSQARATTDLASAHVRQAEAMERIADALEALLSREPFKEAPEHGSA